MLFSFFIHFVVAQIVNAAFDDESIVSLVSLPIEQVVQDS